MHRTYGTAYNCDSKDPTQRRGKRFSLCDGLDLPECRLGIRKPHRIQLGSRRLDI